MRRREKRSHRARIGAVGIRSAVCPLITVLLIFAGLSLLDPGEGEITRDTPAGYYSIAEAVSDYPGKVLENGTSYDIVSDLSLPASRPLHLGPGDTLRFSGGVYLNLSAPPLFEGTGDRIDLIPRIPGDFWGGITLFEGDPTTTPVMENVLISEARVGIRTRGGSDLDLRNSTVSGCERSGIELTGPVSVDSIISISGTLVDTCGNYGIHLSEIPSSRLDGLEVHQCTTGIRLFRSEMELTASNISDCTALGVSLVNSQALIRDTLIEDTGASATSVTDQLISLNSTLEICGSRFTGGKQCILLQRGSSMTLTDSFVSNGFTDCIQAVEADLLLENVEISDALESAMHLVDSDVRGVDLILKDNGKGTGGIVYSTIYLDRTTMELESSTVINSGDAHFHLNSSRIVIANSTLGEYGNDPIILQQSSTGEYVNIRPPSDPRFVDILSQTVNVVTPTVIVRSYSTGEPISGVQVDIEDRNGVILDSGSTDNSGRAGPFYIRSYTNHTSGTVSKLPVRVIATMEDYEVSITELFSPPMEIDMTLYPPNDPPSLNLISPLNGTVSSGEIMIEGYISDDLDILKLRYRVDQGSYTEVNITDTMTGGYFTEVVDLGSLSRGEHTLWIHAFDGSHMSVPAIRSIISNGSGLDDSDEDGIPDIMEDANRNGIVDENETDPEDPDTDGDGLLDGIELDASDGNTTDPLSEDTDGDFILDGNEDANGNGRVDENETDPNNKDTDGDGRTDLDDRFPLDPERWDEPDEGNEDSSIVLVMVVIILVLVIILVYAVFQKLSLKRTSGEDEEVREIKRRGPDRKR